ncbi:MAG: SMP-30/gluconolactonase/LRE family protein [Kiloniellaceae bacterium]
MFFAAPPEIETEVFARLPDALRIHGQTPPWVAYQRRGDPTDSFLEGPSFDRAGNLWCVDIPYGRILKVSPAGQFTVAAQYDGEPNGLKFHKDGRAFIADHKQGLMVLDPDGSEVRPFFDRPLLERFRGLNDLVFASNGDLYFTDQGQGGVHDWSGRVYRLSAAGRLDLILDNIPSPNGLVLSPDERTLFVNVTRTNSVWRVPLLPEGGTTKVGVFLQLSGGLIGPDGLAIDERGNLAVCHAGLGTVWLFSAIGEPLARIRSCTGLTTTNLAYGGPDRRDLYIIESETGTILKARLEVPGLTMFAQM